ncbi:hypothetical protein A8U91_02547 [Halomonas elongata]|uniref:Uncharacterized protein n=1 Tax=Halomonas elongata TaxID=2746 RepID=A0A1B8P7F7_HALEL|nr:hypothetical protein A8U91_02547 [Halomonas elongata]
MTGCHPVAHFGEQGFSGQHLKKARAGIINLVAMDIYQPIVISSQSDHFLQGRLTKLAGIFKMRNRTDDIGSHLDCLLHQCQTIGIGKDTLLRKGHDLNLKAIVQFIT